MHLNSPSFPTQSQNYARRSPDSDSHACISKMATDIQSVHREDKVIDLHSVPENTYYSSLPGERIRAL